MKIIDNFLEPSDYERIEESMLDGTFPWFVGSITNDEDDQELFHMFYKDHVVNSSYWELILPIIEKINPHALVRVRAALMPKGEQNTSSGWHKDVTFDCTTAIYYVNSNNGYTLFEDGTKVESVANRFVFFNSQSNHTGINSTDTSFRCLINFNYF